MDIDAIQNTIKSISRRVDAAANSMFSSNFNSKDQMSRYFMHVISRFSFCQLEYRNLYLTGREHQRWKLDFYKLKHMMTQISVPGKKKRFLFKGLYKLKPSKNEVQQMKDKTISHFVSAEWGTIWYKSERANSTIWYFSSSHRWNTVDV